MSKKDELGMNYRLIVYMPYLLKSYLEEMSSASGESMSQLINRLIIAEYTKFEISKDKVDPTKGADKNDLVL